MPYALKGTLSVGLLGDIIQTRGLRQFKDENFVALTRKLQDCDAVLGNLECLYHDWEMSYGNVNAMTALAAPPRVLDDLRWLGLDAVSLAMNHAHDCGEGGLSATVENCHRRDLAVVGAGNSRAEAFGPTFLDTAAGRVAFFGVATELFTPESSHAGPPGKGIPAKAGIAVLRHDRVHSVPSALYAQLVAASERLELPSGQNDGVKLFGGNVVKGDAFHTETRCNREDLAEIVAQISAAKKVADVIIQTIHCHENGPDGELFNGGHKPSVPDFLVEFAHVCIDAGADVIFGHGPHIIRGIELYRDKPIFYSLGNFSFQPETMTKVPAHSMLAVGVGQDAAAGDWGQAFSTFSDHSFAADKRCYQGILPICSFSGGVLESVEILPLDLGGDEPLSQRGRPVIASGDTAADIHSWLCEVSSHFGTTIGRTAEESLIFLPSST